LFRSCHVEWSETSLISAPCRTKKLI
jgi:hypothetical protein